VLPNYVLEFEPRDFFPPVEAKLSSTQHTTPLYLGTPPFSYLTTRILLLLAINHTLHDTKMTIPATLNIPTAPDLASSPGPFEGPEKLLEIWFAPSSDAACSAASSHASSSRLRQRSDVPGASPTSNFGGLRRVPRAIWEEMLDIVKCKVLSTVEGEDLDAYLLSWVQGVCVGRQLTGQRIIPLRRAPLDHSQDVRDHAQPARVAPHH
jgi:S-adenosylmethionine decarboxylase